VQTPDLVPRRRNHKLNVACINFTKHNNLPLKHGETSITNPSASAECAFCNGGSEWNPELLMSSIECTAVIWLRGPNESTTATIVLSQLSKLSCCLCLYKIESYVPTNFINKLLLMVNRFFVWWEQNKSNVDASKRD